MKTRYKHIHFVEETGTEGLIWCCKNNKSKDILGYVDWYPSWRQWVFFARDNLRVFSADCLQDIIRFIDQLPKTGER